jgi:hypothetical protein
MLSTASTGKEPFATLRNAVAVLPDLLNGINEEILRRHVLPNRAG